MASFLLCLWIKRAKAMEHKIMLLFDSEPVRREALQYALGLAERMDSHLILLGLLPFSDEENPSKEIETTIKRAVQVRKTLKKRVASMQNPGRSAEVAVRIGNPRSELVKFLAESGRFEVVVWGGRPDLMKNHDCWLAGMKDALGCAVVAPVMKSDATPRRNSSQ